MAPTDPIIVIGAGHNGLTAAAHLARNGRNVVVLESTDRLGGITATEPLIPHYRFNTGFANTGGLLPQVVEDLDLARFGYNPVPAKTAVHIPTPSGSLTITADGTLHEGGATGKNSTDMDRLPGFLDALTRAAGVLDAMRQLTPPALQGAWTISELWPWARLALKVRGLGEREMMDFLRVLPMSAAEFLDEHLTDDRLKGAFALFATLGLHLGPLGSGTALNLLYQFIGGLAPVFARGGAGEVSAALKKSLEASGGVVRMETVVERILIENGRAAGVQIAGGETIRASAVVSSLDATRTFLELTGAHYLPVRVSRRVNNIRYRGSTASVHFALSSLPDFGAEPGQLDGWIAITDGTLSIEKAYDDAKYRRASTSPALLVHIPSLADPAMAPEGKHGLTAWVRYAPFGPELDREWIERNVRERIGRVSPGFESTVLDSRTILPRDYAQSYGLSEGAWAHGQMGLDQMLVMRPIPGWSRYTTPIDGLYLCGSSTHPGGGLTAAPGYNAARTILASPGR